MDIIISGPDRAANERTAQMILAKILGVTTFEECAHAVSSVNPTFENLDAIPMFGAVLADELPTFVHLVGAKVSVEEFRLKRNRPYLVAVYCSTFDPITGEALSPIKTPPISGSCITGKHRRY